MHSSSAAGRSKKKQLSAISYQLLARAAQTRSRDLLEAGLGEEQAES
jgi:hypothetical protein